MSKIEKKRKRVRGRLDCFKKIFEFVPFTMKCLFKWADPGLFIVNFRSFQIPIQMTDIQIKKKQT